MRSAMKHPPLLHAITVGTHEYEIQVERTPDGPWKASGEFDGKLLAVTGRSQNNAIYNWRKRAEAAG